LTSPSAHYVRRWVVLSEDGRYATLGQATDPTPEEILHVEDAMRGQGLAGWLAVMEGSPHAEAPPRLMEVRALNEPAVPFSDVAAAALASIADTSRQG